MCLPPFQTHSTVTYVCGHAHMYLYMNVYSPKYINTTCSVCMLLLRVYDFRADHLVLDHQLGAILWGDYPAFGIPWLFVVLCLLLWAL